MITTDTSDSTPATLGEWLVRLDRETGMKPAWDAYSMACAAGVFGGLPLNLTAGDEERLQIVAENGWTACYDETQGWI